MQLRSVSEVRPHRFVGKLRTSTPGEPAVMSVMATRPDGDRVELVFYLASTRRERGELSLQRSVRAAIAQRSPEILQLPDYDYGPVICFQSWDHFVLDLNSQMARKVHWLDEYGYYVK